MMITGFKSIALSALLFSGLGMGLIASPAEDAARAARAFTEREGERLVADFRSFLALPNHGRDAENIMKNAAWIERYLAPRGFTSEIWQQGGAPYVFAERLTPGAEKTVLIYAHFDGQPVAPENWASPPFEPTLRTDLVENNGTLIEWDLVSDIGLDPSWRLFARSAGDDKAPVIAIAAALDALDEAGIATSVNIKLILDGEEEIGSPSLARILEAHGEALAADLLLFCDGPMHQSGQRQLVFGVRGSMTVDLTTYGPSRPLHSGHYGNFAPHPTDDLIRLLASLKTPNGEIAVVGYDRQVRLPSEAEKEAIQAMPNINQKLQRDLALGRVEGGDDRIELLVMRPAIIVKGFQAGGVGDQARNIILPTATASLNLRLAPDQTPEYVRRVLENHFVGRGYTITYAEPSDEERRANPRMLKVDWRPGPYPGYRSALDGPAALALKQILTEVDGRAPLMTPTMGGSLPIHVMAGALDMPIILLPVANHDNNQHGRNENIRLGNLFEAVAAYAGVIAAYGSSPSD